MIVTFRNYPPLLANSLSCCLVYYFVHPFLFCLVLFRTAYSFPSSRSVRYPTDKRCCFVSTGLRPFISGERDRQTDRKKRKDRDELHIERGERKKKETGKKCCSIDSSLSELGSTPWDADANPLDTSWMWWRLRYYRVPSSHTRTLFCEHHKKRINFYAMSAIDSSCTT